VRIGLLAGLAGFVVLAGWDNPGASVVEWTTGLTRFKVIGLIIGASILGLFAAGGWLLLNLLRQQGRLLLRLEALEARLGGDGALPAQLARQAVAGLPVGAAAPSFQLPAIFGETLTLDSLRAASRPVLLIFTDPNCAACSDLLPNIAYWQKELAATLTLAVISRGSADENRAKATQLQLTQFLLQRENEVAKAYRVNGTPSSVLVQPDGSIGSALAQGLQELRALLGNLSGSLSAHVRRPPLGVSGKTPCSNCGAINGNGSGARVMPAAPSIGQPAPALKLPDLAGDIVDLVSFRGSEITLLFWNPRCGFCQQMIPDLSQWEREAGSDTPVVLIVSSGAAEEHQGLELQSRIVLQPDLSLMYTFGVTGTPSAVWIDRDGRIASPVVAGAPDVLALIRRKSSRIINPDFSPRGEPRLKVSMVNI
jgi:methylamine dehydrogenase accessory protein MauD